MVANVKPSVQSGERRGPTSSLGRPASRESRKVQEDIVRAAETCLESKNPDEISTKEIASLAGTRSAMVYYYFGSKDGLLIDIIRRGLNEVQHDFQKTHEAILRNESPDPTRTMISAFANIYNNRPALCRVLISEVFHSDSPIRSYLRQQWPYYGKMMLMDVLTKLSASGYYRQDLNIEGIYEMIYSVIFFPLVMKHPLAQKQSDNHLDDQWVEFVSTVFDSYLRARK